jgi:hypothetical protein
MVLLLMHLLSPRSTSPRCQAGGCGAQQQQLPPTLCRQIQPAGGRVHDSHDSLSQDDDGGTEARVY